MKFDILTLFPELVDSILSSSIIGRARTAGLLSVKAHQIRLFAENKHNNVDDTPYGGGAGMVMAAPPIYRCYRALI
jgi:tRNA (guanine37-N1)-methyltransferase